MSVYPVQGGIVYNPWNDFGFGTGLSTADFVSRLRGKIGSILAVK